MKLYLQIVDAIISHGCFLRECSVEHSIVGVRSRLEYGVELKVSHGFLVDFSLPSYTIGMYKKTKCSCRGSVVDAAFIFHILNSFY